MARIRSDLKFGTITDNPLAIGGTSVNSAQFATLPTVAGSDELWITLDPEGSNREIVKVTAHSAAATVCTVVRGQLGTAAAQHASGTRWVHGAITTDLVIPCTSSTRPTLGLWAGMRIYETDTNREYVYNGTAWRAVAAQQKVLISGTTAISFTAANSVAGTINFGVTFAVAPIVTATIEIGANNDVLINLTATPTTTGVSFRAFQKAGVNITTAATIYWHAHGELA